MSRDAARDELFVAAENGDRLTLVAPTTRRLWAGLGNRAGLHSYMFTILHERFVRGRDRLARVLDSLPDGARVEIHRFRNTSRDRGRWCRVRTVVLAGE